MVSPARRDHVGAELVHDPEKLADFSDKIMRKEKKSKIASI
jgi:hypothetical protein